MNNLTKDCGDVHLCMGKKGANIIFYDANYTYFKIISKLNTFVATVCGSDLEAVAPSHANDVYLREVKKTINKKHKNVKVKEQDLVLIKTGSCKIRVQERKQNFRYYRKYWNVLGKM